MINEDFLQQNQELLIQSGHSLTAKKEDSFYIVRTLENPLPTTVKSVDEHLQRRLDAIQLYNEVFPEFVLPTETLATQNDNLGKVLIRRVPFLNNLRTTNTINNNEIKQNPYYRESLKTIYTRALDSIMGGIYFNLGTHSFNRINNIPGTGWLNASIGYSNIFVGEQNQGNEKIVLDNDWYITQAEADKYKPITYKAKRSFSLLRNLFLLG